MSHRLQDITLYYWFKNGTVRKRFTMKQNVICALYVQYLNGYKPPKTSRISVQLGNADYAGKHIGSILGPTAKFDVEHYWQLDDAGQNRMILDTVHRIALLCAEHHGWNRTPFDSAFERVLAVDFKYSVEAKPKMSKDRLHSATIRIEKDERCSTISAVFFKKGRQTEMVVELLKSFHNELFYGGLTKNYKWFSTREFGLYSPSDEIIIKASLDHPNATTTITPQRSDREQLEGYLRRATYVDFKTDEERIRWANQ